eukprot:COSAG02_NODE_481_length_21461_cov_43.885597_3_plen_104_part_00
MVRRKGAKSRSGSPDRDIGKDRGGRSARHGVWRSAGKSPAAQQAKLGKSPAVSADLHLTSFCSQERSGSGKAVCMAGDSGRGRRGGGGGEGDRDRPRRAGCPP